jgi:hypothetical protein
MVPAVDAPDAGPDRAKGGVMRKTRLRRGIGSKVSPMKPNPFDQCLAALEAEPMSYAERVAYESQLAAVRAEDERRRLPTPQLELKAA